MTQVDPKVVLPHRALTSLFTFLSVGSHIAAAPQIFKTGSFSEYPLVRWLLKYKSTGTDPSSELKLYSEACVNSETLVTSVLRPSGNESQTDSDQLRLVAVTDAASLPEALIEALSQVRLV